MGKPQWASRMAGAPKKLRRERGEASTTKAPFAAAHLC